MKYFHNPRCSKSRQGLELLKENGIQPEIVFYLETPPTEIELTAIIKKLGIKPLALIRKTEKIFKENYKGKTLSDKEWIQAMVLYPKLIERPILIDKNRASIGRPPEDLLSIL